MGLYDAVGYQPNGTNPIAVLPSQIDEVDGEAGARALTMAPNSGKLALDKSAPILWVIKTDNYGNKVMVAPWDITPHVPEPDPAIKALDSRMTSMEGKFDAILEQLNKFEEMMK